ncbi:metabolite traffic protein EboE [Mycobacterium riyadhense]|uniref:Isomerase n=1 Tax=Mycobacterium riyadhense TaxID=486698 RepID=A0A1X2D6K9_9MYCO|nr:metabolite traffic protein EboE [Mycobacterium riyadhense]MCV7149456.1 metabolite traffic protein EboE [Mycobacterium riyadhense]ORW83803.1 isomerase [Mycobacterium riyadhense]
MLSYCSNVVAADTLLALERQLLSVFAPARERARLEQLGVGLWLPARTMAPLSGDRRARRRLAAILADSGLTVATLNAFPYGDFHGGSVKHAVYQPDWTTPKRLQYTRDCADVLSELLVDTEHGSISTLPLGWSDPWDDEADRKARNSLSSLGDKLRRIEDGTGHRIRLAIEPEPGCVIGSCRDAIGWLGSAVEAGDVDPRYVGVCLDTCHLAVMYEDPLDVLSGLAEMGIEVVKIQASNAIQIDDLADDRVVEAFAEFANSPYLHQVFGFDADGQRWFRDDLSFADPSTPRSGTARVHYHVPLHISPPAPLGNTSHVLTEIMGMLRDGRLPGPVDVEIETYTWEVLPPSLRMGSLAEDIAAEIRWLDELVRVRDPA